MSSELILERQTPLSAAPSEVYAWHARPGALERLVPPWHHVEVESRKGGINDGARVDLKVHVGPVTLSWTAEHRDVEPGKGFTDIQIKGPFDRWVHRHRFDPSEAGGTILSDRILCELPLGMRLGRSCVERDIERMLVYRHAVTAGDLAMHGTVAGRPRLRVAVTGAKGLIGTMVCAALTTGGHQVLRITRGRPAAGELQWDPNGGGLDPQGLTGIDAVVHLAGEQIAGRWTESRKRNVLESRRTGTRLLAEAIARAPNGPRTLVSASAIGFYGDRGDAELTEASAPGEGFLPEVCQAWEEATGPAASAGVRVVSIRTGLVLTPAGGLLQRMLVPFRVGLGGRLGDGNQWMSWIGADDLVGVFHHALTMDTVSGPVNAVAPGAVRNAEFTRALGAVLRRPTPFPVPKTALRLRFGQMADEAILASAHVIPAVLRQTGYRFRYETLDLALAHLLGVERPS